MHGKTRIENEFAILSTDRLRFLPLIARKFVYRQQAPGVDGGNRERLPTRQCRQRG